MDDPSEKPLLPSRSAHGSSRADLCQRTIEAADSSMFKYLTFFAAIHTAALAVLADEHVGLSAVLGATAPDGFRSTPQIILAIAAGLMAVLCFLIARGLLDAFEHQRAATLHGMRLEGSLAAYFQEVHENGIDPDRSFRHLFRGSGRLLPRHARNAGLVVIVGILWAGFLLWISGAVGAMIAVESPWDLRDQPVSLTVGLLAVATAISGTILLLQILYLEVLSARSD